MAPAESISAARPVGKDRWMALRGGADRSERPVEEKVAVAEGAGMLCASRGKRVKGGQRGGVWLGVVVGRGLALGRKVAGSAGAAVPYDWVP